MSNGPVLVIACSGDMIVGQEQEANRAARVLLQVAIEEDAEGLSVALR